MSWKVKRASKGYDPHPQIRYGARPTEQDGQITALKLPMSTLVFDIREEASGMPAFVTLELTEDAGYGFILARPDQEDETVYVVRSCAWFPPEMPYAWLPLEDFGGSTPLACQAQSWCGACGRYPTEAATDSGLLP